MSEPVPNEPVAIRCNPQKIRGLLAKIKLDLRLQGHQGIRDGDVLELALTRLESSISQGEKLPK